MEHRTVQEKKYKTYFLARTKRYKKKQEKNSNIYINIHGSVFLVRNDDSVLCDKLNEHFLFVFILLASSAHTVRVQQGRGNRYRE